MHPFILPHTMGGCVKHRVKRSAIFDAVTARYLSKAFAAPADSRRKGGIFFAVKMGASPSTGRSAIFHAGSDGNNYSTIWIDHGTGGLRFATAVGGSNVLLKISNRLFRDPTAFYLVYIQWDMDNATSSERVRVWVDGEEITSWATNTVPGPGQDLFFGAALTHYIGRDIVNSDYANILLAEFVRFDNVLPGYTDFLRIDPRSGSVAPIKHSVAHGKHGFYLPMVGDAGDAPATAAEGFKDRAPISGTHVAANDWTPSAFAAADFVKDTPTNYRSGTDYRGNYATWNSVDPAVGFTFSDGGLKATMGAADGTCVVTQGIKAGKYWAEYTIGPSVNNMSVGIVTRAANLTVSGGSITTPSYMYRESGGKYVAGAASAYGAGYVAGDVIRAELNASVPQIEFFKNNVSQGVIPITEPGQEWFFAFGSTSGTSACTINCGQRSPAGTPTAGFLPVCVPALAKASIVKPSTAFVQKVDTAANISAAIASLRSGWGAAYIDIFKRYDAVEGWRWRFGDDAANYLDSSTAVNGKQAFPALAGNYWACSIRVGAAYGVATGEIAHVNGVATTINDNLGTPRKFVTLRRSDAGGDWPASHPDAAAGELFYLNSTAGDAPAADITNVTANSFQIGAGMPSGIYRWVAFADGVGAVAMRGGVANNTSAGPVYDLRGAPGLSIFKNLDVAAPPAAYSTEFNPGNPVGRLFELNSTSGLVGTAYSATYGIDVLSSGVRAVTNSTYVNNSAHRYAVLAFLSSAFATGECPAQGVAR